MHWVLNEEQLIIQALPEINNEDKLDIDFKIASPGLYTFSISKIENVPSDLNIYLKDNSTNTYYDLTEDTAKLIFNSTDEQPNFSVVFQQSSVLSESQIIEDKLQVYYNKQTGNLEIHNSTTKDTNNAYVIFNTLGQKVLNVKSTGNTINVASLSNGVVYIIKSANSNNSGYKFIKY